MLAPPALPYGRTCTRTATPALTNVCLPHMYCFPDHPLPGPNKGLRPLPLTGMYRPRPRPACCRAAAGTCGACVDAGCCCRWGCCCGCSSSMPWLGAVGSDCDACWEPGSCDIGWRMSGGNVVTWLPSCSQHMQVHAYERVCMDSSGGLWDLLVPYVCRLVGAAWCQYCVQICPHQRTHTMPCQHHLQACRGSRLHT